QLGLAHILNEGVCSYTTGCFRFYVNFCFATFKISDRGLFDDGLTRFTYRTRRDAVLLIVTNLLIPTAVGFFNGYPHAFSDGICIHDHASLVVPRGTSYRLDK